MIFLELVLQNFGPYNGRQVINLSPKTDDGTSRPIILLGGMNGGGKTTLMDAIRLALYGHRAQCSTRGNLSYADFLSQCVNNQTPPTEKTFVELVFEHIENDKPVKYRIIRAWEKNPKDGKDELGIYEKDEDWLSNLAGIWDDYIENLLPLGISNLFLFDGEQVKELAEQDAPPPIVVDAISGLLGLELAERLADDLEILINRKRKEFADTKDLANIEEIEQKLKKLQEEYQATKDLEASQITSLQQAEKEQQQAFDKFIYEGGKIAAERSQLEKQRSQTVTLAEQVRDHMCELAADVLPLALIQPLLGQVQEQAEKEFRLGQLEISRDLVLERDQRLINCMSELGIGSQEVEKIKLFLEEDVEMLYAVSTHKQEPWLFADGEALSLLANLLDFSLLASKNTALQQLADFTSKEEEIDTLDRQLQGAASPEDYEKLVNALKTAQNEVAVIKANYEISKRRLVELETTIGTYKKDLKEYSNKNIERKNTEHILTASTKVQQTLEVFRKRLTLRKLNKLETEVTECFRYILHKSDLVHRVVIDTETFSLSLYDSQSQLVPKHRLSAGEKQLLAIAFLWGLARISGRQLPVAIDTPLGRLDSSHRSNLIERYFPTASHQVILLSTDSEIGEKEVQILRENEAIAKEYLLEYNPALRQTTARANQYFDHK